MQVEVALKMTMHDATIKDFMSSRGYFAFTIKDLEKELHNVTLGSLIGWSCLDTDSSQIIIEE